MRVPVHADDLNTCTHTYTLTNIHIPKSVHVPPRILAKERGMKR